MPEPGLIAKQVSLIIGLPWWPQIGSVVINVNYIKARVRIKEAGVGRRQWRAHAVRNSGSVTVEGREFGFLVSSSCNGLAAPSPNKSTNHMEQFTGTLQSQFALRAHGSPCGQKKTERSREKQHLFFLRLTFPKRSHFLSICLSTI